MRVKFALVTVGVALVAAVPVWLPSPAQAGTAASDTSVHVSGMSSTNFGPNVKIFDASMPTSEIQATVDAIANAAK